MNTRLVIAVGHRCSVNSYIASNTPDCVKKFQIGENSEEVLVGTYFKKEFACNPIDISNFDKNEILSFFENYKFTVKQVADQKEFESNFEHDKWLKHFDEASISILVLVVD